MTDVLSAHLDAIEAEGGSSFALTFDAKTGWAATGTKKHGRKVINAEGATAIAAIADFLTQVRGDVPDEPETPLLADV